MEDEYTKIECHLKLSRQLYELDQKGRNILIQFNTKKSKGVRRSGNYIFASPLDELYKQLSYCLGIKRFRLYFYLQYFLDELLYYEVKHTTVFYREDTIHDISKIYFHQNDWVSDMHLQSYEFYQDPDNINVHEAMYLVCYLKEYERFLSDIYAYVKALKDISYIKSKLKYTIRRIKKRHNKIWSIILANINQNLNLTNE